MANRFLTGLTWMTPTGQTTKVELNPIKNNHADGLRPLR